MSSSSSKRRAFAVPVGLAAVGSIALGLAAGRPAAGQDARPTSSPVPPALGATTAPTGSTTAPTTAPAPATGSAAGLPAFHLMLTDAEYREKAAAFAREADARGEPDDGCLIVAVVPDTPAAGDLHLATGEVIVAVDGKPVHSEPEFRRARGDGGTAQVWSVWSPTDDPPRRDVTAPVGKVGVRTADWLSYAGYYRRFLPAGRPVSPDLLLAARAALTDYDLAETALARADDRTPLGRVFAGLVAYHDLRLDEAAAWLAGVPGRLPAAGAGYPARIAYRSDLATFRWPAARKLAAAYPNDLQSGDAFSPQDWAALDDAFREADPAQTAAALFAADRSRIVDQTDHLANVSTDEAEQGVSKWSVAQLLGPSRRADYKLPNDRQQGFAAGPSDANADLSVRCRLKPTVARRGQFDRSLFAALEYDDGRDAVKLSVDADSLMARVTGEGMPPCQVDLRQYARHLHPFTVRLTVAGPLCQVQVEDLTVARGLVTAAPLGRAVHVHVQCVGILAHFDHLQWRTTPAI